MPGHVDLDRDVVFDWHRKERRGLNLEVGQLTRNGSGEVDIAPLLSQLEFHLMKLGRLTGKLDLQVSTDAGGVCIRLRQPRAHLDHGELAGARDLHGMNVTVAVARIEGFHGYGDQEVALAFVANALAAGRVADPVDMMQGVRNRIGERALREDPLLIGRGERREN